MTGFVVLACLTLVAAFAALVAWVSMLRDAVLPDAVEAADEARLSWCSTLRECVGVRADQLRGDVSRN